MTLDASHHLFLISPSLFSPSLLWVSPDVRGADQNRRDTGRIQGESLRATKRVRWVAKLLFSSVFGTSLTTVTITQHINYINGTNKVWLHPRLRPPPRKKWNFLLLHSVGSNQSVTCLSPPSPCLHSYPHLLLSFCSYCSDAFCMWFWFGFHKIWMPNTSGVGLFVSLKFVRTSGKKTKETIPRDEMFGTQQTWSPDAEQFRWES